MKEASANLVEASVFLCSFSFLYNLEGEIFAGT